LLAVFSPRATPGVELVTGDTYARTLRVGDARGWIEIEPISDAAALQLCAHLSDASAVATVAERARRLFDLDADPLAIAAQLRSDAWLAPLVDRRPGLRVPGAWDPFELAVRAILGQQITVRGATTLAGRLVAALGEPLECDGRLTHLFPDAATLAAADVAAIGIPRARAGAIRALARAVADGALALDACRGLDDAVARLTALPGIGEWTAQYIAMRAFGEPDAFPHGDLSLRIAFGNNAAPVPAVELARAAEAWRPWRAYAALQLWSHRADGEDE
jgi:3-methyladenine DNA glycosylase/8-oxoguanine DNA glycosylase